MRLLPVLGPSGCGKSSLARAGLIPEIARRPLPGRKRARVAIFTPGPHPVEALAGVLAKIATNDIAPVVKTREFASELKRVNDAKEYDGLRRIADLLPDIILSPLIVLVDQFEEVYSLCKNITERQAFIENLLHAAGDLAARVSVILTLRSDFLGETQKHITLSQAITSNGFIIPAMSMDELERAITRPAEQAGHPLDESTVKLLVEETEGREGALPLLQFALTRIWEGLREGIEPAVTLEDIGGVGGALAGEAQRVFDHLSEEEKVIARRVFLGLVQLGEGARDTRRRTKIESLVSYKEKPEQVKKVITRFASVNTRLITVSGGDGTEMAEVTHEALFDHWGQLNQWLDSSRDDIRFQRRLEDAARHWDENGRPEGSLWRPPDLDLLRQYHERTGDDMTPLQLIFFNASQQAEKARQNLRRLGISGLIFGLVVTTTMACLAVLQLQRANIERMEAYAATAEALLDTNPAEGLINAISAIGLSQSFLVKFPNRKIPTLVQSSLLNTIQATQERNLLRHEADVGPVSFSPDGQTVASGSADGTVRLWDLDGNPIGKPFHGHHDKVLSVAFSSDGRTIIVSGYHKDKKVRVLTLWDLQGNSIGKPFYVQQETVEVAFSPDAKTIVTGSNKGILQLWDFQGHPLGKPFEGHKGPVSSLAFSPKGDYIVSGGWNDGSVGIWNLKDLKNYQIGHPNPGHEIPILSLVFSPDGQSIASGSADGTVRLWDLQGNPIGQPFRGHRLGVYSVAFSPDNQMIVSGSWDRTVRLWNAQTGQQLGQPFRGHNDTVNSVAFSPDGQSIASGSQDGTVRLWDLQPPPIGQIFRGHQGVIESVAFSPDDQMIVSGSSDRTVRLWNAQTGQQLGQPFRGHNDTVNSVAFSPDGQSIASGSADGTVRLWDLQGNPIGQPFRGHQTVINSVAFSPDGQSIASGSQDGWIRLWDLQGNPIGQPFREHEGWVNSVAFSPNGQTIASGSYSTLQLWDLQGNPIGYPWEVSSISVAFSPDGKHIVSTDGSTVRLFDLQGNPIGQPFRGHYDAVMSVAFSPDGQRIVSGGIDGSVRLWDLQGNPIGQPFRHESFGARATFSHNGLYIVSGGGGGDRTVRLWWISWKKWLQIGCEQLYFHSGLRTPQTDVAREAKKTCKRYVWSKSKYTP